MLGIAQGVLIGKVNCDEDLALCNKFDVTGTPTLLYGLVDDLKEYGGDKDFPSLNSWAKEVLFPICSPDGLEYCSGTEKQWIESWMQMTPDEIQGMIDSNLAAEENIEKTL